MRVLVTGGMGFIGSYVVRALLQDGAEVVSVDVSTDSNQAHLVLRPDELEAVRQVQADVADTALIHRLVGAHDVDAVVHLVHAADTTGTNPAWELRTNLGGFLNVMEAARTFGVPRVVWASSSSVFGSGSAHDGPVGRDAPHRPRIPYEAYKAHNENVGDYYARTQDVSSIALRFNYVYGYGRRVAPGRPGFDQGLFLDPAAGRTGRVPMSDGVGLWQYVEDTAGTVLAALDADPSVHGAFNTCGSVVGVRDIAALVARRLPRASFEFLPGELDFVYDVDDSETQSALGYRQRFDMAAGVERTLDATLAALPEGPNAIEQEHP